MRNTFDGILTGWGQMSGARRTRTAGDDAAGCLFGGLGLAGLAAASFAWRVVDSVLGRAITVVVALAFLVAMGFFYYGQSKMRELDRLDGRPDGSVEQAHPADGQKVD